MCQACHCARGTGATIAQDHSLVDGVMVVIFDLDGNYGHPGSSLADAGSIQITDVYAGSSTAVVYGYEYTICGPVAGAVGGPGIDRMTVVVSQAAS